MGRTLGGLHDQGLAVLAHSAGVEGLHPGLVRAVKVEAVHRADGLRPHVDLLRRHTVRSRDAGPADLPSPTPPFSAASVGASPIWQISERGRGCSPR